MKKIILLLVAAFFVAELSAQKLTVTDFELRERDLTAKVKPRNDNNGDACALLRVQIAAPNCQFSDSYIVGEPEQGFGEYLVYMAKGARRIRVVHPDFLFVPLDYEFPEPLQSMRTYALVLEVPIYTHYAEIVDRQTQKPAAQPTTQPTAQPATQPAVTTPFRKPGTYQVGDYYNKDGKEGVVFWVDETGRHGKIVSMTESSSGLQWSSDKYERKRLIGAVSETNGAENMKVYGLESKYPAFKWCLDLGKGWYLPAINELKTLYLNRDAVNRTLEQKGGKKLGDVRWYWSSTESSRKDRGKFCAWFVYMFNGYTGSNRKHSYYYVRAVSAF